jgi:phosphoribosylformylglycinamidine cyclo-ligase
VALGHASSGVHTNGYSLVRKVVEEQESAQISWSGPAPFESGASLGEVLLRPTRIYVKSCLALARAGLAKAMAHITGGGLVENVPRVVPDDATVTLDARAWTLPPVFRWLADAGRIAPDELVRVFNCGIGMVVIVAPERADEAMRILAGAGETVARIGTIGTRATPDTPGCVVANLASWGLVAR